MDIENDLERNVTVHVRITMSGETVHNESHLLEPDSSKQVYNTDTDDPDGSEAFGAVVTVGNVTERVRIPTNACNSLGPITISEDKRGEPRITTAMAVC
ncbi:MULTISPECIES: hypothetical protein [Haloferax]|uniref:Uncharacterized protein n=1 Tax=Haloferax marinum TaxID=2666143 RepID=A0A6A8G4H0_9EURY|nr:MULTISPECIES: hypothetical protein [Haloferax]KAB1196847.1 hypothetical protein Hfx1150_04635 [Haloferax sp. CBA1150]MRW95859.1 hypothetical protein [Haloferax marinum]